MPSKAVPKDDFREEARVRTEFNIRLKHMYEEAESIIADAEECKCEHGVNLVLAQALADVLHEMVGQSDREES